MLVTSCASGSTETRQMSPPAGLRAAQDRIYVGSAVGGADVTGALGDRIFTKFLTTDFNSVTPENALKWAVIHPAPDRFDFSPMDQLARFARENHLKVRGHTLLWPGAEPAWVAERVHTCAQARAVLESHIETVVKRYADIVGEWDVANEIYDEKGVLRIQQSSFLQACGESIIGDALRWASSHASGALLFLNDYDLEQPNARVDAYLGLIRRLRDAGVPVDAMGLQSHLRLSDGLPRKLPEVMSSFAGMDVRVALTELDVRIDRVEDVARDEAKQAEAYEFVVRTCRLQPQCTGVTVWGFTDRYSWVEDAVTGAGNATIRTREYTPKPAYDAFRRALNE